jgi:hypothetical protein
MWPDALHVEGAERGWSFRSFAAGACRVRRRVGNGCGARRLRRVILGRIGRWGGRGRRGSRGLRGILATDERESDSGEQGEARTEQSGFHENSFLNETTDAHATTRQGQEPTVESHREPQALRSRFPLTPAKPYIRKTTTGVGLASTRKTLCMFSTACGRAVPDSRRARLDRKERPAARDIAC